ncbi:JAB domain-containing protein [Sphingomonas sp. CJ20]
MSLDRAKLERVSDRDFAQLIEAHHALLAHSLRDRLLDGRTAMVGEDLARFLVATLGDCPTERLLALYLDRGNRLIADEQVGEGEPGRLLVSARAIVNRALELEASALVFAHNHPGGGLLPSTQDVAFTRRMIGLFSHIGIHVHDHLIVAGSHCTSLRARGDLE